MQYLNWKEFIEKSKKYYYEICSISCPAFGGELIYFNSHGYKHLIRKGKDMRNLEQQKRRIELLPIAVKILSESAKFEEYYISNKTINNGAILKISICHFWSFEKSFNKKIVTVVVRKIQNGRKHYLSVMDKDIP
ncbi:MAG: hypothetical protein AAB470_02565 [Patescibacteria group bacterium]